MIKKSLKTLAILSPGFPAHEGDTTCLPTQQAFIRSLNKLYPELQIIVFAVIYPYHKKKYHWYNNLIIPFNGKKYGRIFRPLLWLMVYLELKRNHRLNAIDGVISFWYGDTALIGNFFSKKLKVQHYCWIKGQDARGSNFFVRWVGMKATQLVTLSDFLTDEFERNHNIRPEHVVYNGVDQNDFSHLPTNKDIDILGVGSLIPLKQYSIFIDVAKAMVSLNATLKVVLAGAGPEENKLREQISAADLDTNISLIGEVSHKEAIKLMERSKILLHPSSYEGYSTVCLEALAAGCHVVSFVKAETKPVTHWHVINNKSEMMSCCIEILSNDCDFTPQIIHKMDDNAKRIVELLIKTEDSK